jgi:hypothetical protein
LLVIISNGYLRIPILDSVKLLSLLIEGSRTEQRAERKPMEEGGASGCWWVEVGGERIKE